MMPLMSQADIDYLLHFSKKDRKTGKLSKSLYFYKYRDNWDFTKPPRYNIYFNEKPKDFPPGFIPNDYVEVFDNTYCIGIDEDDITNPNLPFYFNCNQEQKEEFDSLIERGARTNSRLMIFNKHTPEQMHFTTINIWGEPTDCDFWFRMQIRPNRIYFSDYDGFKIYDFELNLLFLRPVKKYQDVYGFYIDPDNYNNAWFWSADEYTKYTQKNNIPRQSHEKYTNMKGVKEICDYVETGIL